MKKHPSISLDVLDFVAPKIQTALRKASASLTNHGIRHAICGGVAVGAYGHIRATKDVDFLVGDEAFVGSDGSSGKHHGVVMLAPGVPFVVDKIPTDMVSMTDDMRFMEAELTNPVDFDGLPMVSPECLVTMKLIAHRLQDNTDVVKLLEAGAVTFAGCRNYLAHNGRQDLIPRLERLAALDGDE